MRGRSFSRPTIKMENKITELAFEVHFCDIYRSMVRLCFVINRFVWSDLFSLCHVWVFQFVRDVFIHNPHELWCLKAFHSADKRCIGNLLLMLQIHSILEFCCDARQVLQVQNLAPKLKTLFKSDFLSKPFLRFRKWKHFVSYLESAGRLRNFVESLSCKWRIFRCCCSVTDPWNLYQCVGAYGKLWLT